MRADNDNGLRFLSVCSGIEAASVAFEPLGWRAVAFSEIEKFPSAVLKHHYPDVPNLGDFTEIDTTKLGRVDILCGGTPCQTFSIAGLREGIKSERGNLTLKFVELAHELAAGNGLRNVVWENVVGILSSKDNAFGCFLAGLVGADAPIEPVKRWTSHGMVSGPKGRAAWSVLDAQYFGVAQRRRRVLVVADFGNGADPATVLFVEEGVPRNPPSRGEAGESTANPIAPSIVSSGRGVERTGDTRGQDPVVACVRKWPADIASTLDTTFGPKMGLDDQHINAGAPWFVPQAIGVTGTTSHSLTAEGADASEDGAGRGTPVVAFVQNSRDEVRLMNGDGQIVGSLAAEPGAKQQCYIAQPVCFTAKDYGADAAYDISPTLRSGNHNASHANGGVMPAVTVPAQTVAIRGRDGGATVELGGEVATALRASQGGGDKPHVLTTKRNDENGNAYEDDASSILSTLRKEAGEEAFAEWEYRVLAAFRSEEVLRSWLHGKSIREQAEDFRSFVDDCALPCSQDEAGGLLREVWLDGPNGCSPQGRELAKQLAGKSGEALPVLPSEGTSHQADVQHMREAGEGARLLRQALSAVQEIRRPINGEGKPELTTSAVRRLTARECERLQGFQFLCSPGYPGAWQDDAGRWWSPDYTAIPWRGKPAEDCPDGPRYKALGNSWAVPKFAWLGARIQRFMPSLVEPANDNQPHKESA